MKTTYTHLIACLLFLDAPCIVRAQVFANDVEPNNGIASAIPVTLGVAFEGRLDGYMNDQLDFYTITIPEDGVLHITMECEEDGPAQNPLCLYEINPDSSQSLPGSYASMGTALTPLTTSEGMPCMKAGQHFFHVHNPSFLPTSYRITFTTLELFPFADDAEPNDLYASAIPLVQGIPVEGRMGVEHPDQGTFDPDIYVIDKNSFGPLSLMTMSGSSSFLTTTTMYVDVYDAQFNPMYGCGFAVQVGGQTILTGTHIACGAMQYPGVYFLVFSTSPCTYYKLQWMEDQVGVEEVSGQEVPVVTRYDAASGTFQFSGPDISKITVVDAAGRTISEEEVNKGARTVWNAANAKCGVYLARLIDTHGHHSTVRCVLAR